MISGRNNNCSWLPDSVFELPLDLRQLTMRSRGVDDLWQLDTEVSDVLLPLFLEPSQSWAEQAQCLTRSCWALKQCVFTFVKGLDNFIHVVILTFVGLKRKEYVNSAQGDLLLFVFEIIRLHVDPCSHLFVIWYTAVVTTSSTFSILVPKVCIPNVTGSLFSVLDNPTAWRVELSVFNEIFSVFILNLHPLTSSPTEIWHFSCQDLHLWFCFILHSNGDLEVLCSFVTCILYSNEAKSIVRKNERIIHLLVYGFFRLHFC